MNFWRANRDQGIDSKPRATVLSPPPSCQHQFNYTRNINLHFVVLWLCVRLASVTISINTHLDEVPGRLVV